MGVPSSIEKNDFITAVNSTLVSRKIKSGFDSSASNDKLKFVDSLLDNALGLNSETTVEIFRSFCSQKGLLISDHSAFIKIFIDEIDKINFDSFFDSINHDSLEKKVMDRISEILADHPELKSEEEIDALTRDDSVVPEVGSEPGDQPAPSDQIIETLKSAAYKSMEEIFSKKYTDAFKVIIDQFQK